MRRTAAWILSLVALAALAQGSTVENATFAVCLNAMDQPMAEEYCTYQYDGGHHGDASDACAAPGPVLPEDVEVTGVVFPPLPPSPDVPTEDPEDNYAFHVAAVGSQVRVRLTPGTQWNPLTGAPVAYEVAIWGPVGNVSCMVPLASASPNGTPWHGANLGFVSASAGVHTIQVRATAVSLAGLEGEIPLACHFMCAGTVNNLIGYRLITNETP